MKNRVIVNRHNIAWNKKHKEEGEVRPVLVAHSYKESKRGNRVDILDSDGEILATFVYRPENPLSCGATVWMVTDQPIRVSPE